MQQRDGKEPGRQAAFALVKRAARGYLGEDLPDEDIESLVQMGLRRQYAKGTQLIATGERNSVLYFMLEGVVRGYMIDAGGNDMTHFFIVENMFFNADYMITREPSLCNFEALTDIDVYQFDVDQFKRLMMVRPALMNAYVGALEASLRRKVRRQSDLLLKSATERYLDFDSRYPGLEARVHQSDIASYLGITPVSLSRIRRVLREREG